MLALLELWFVIMIAKQESSKDCGFDSRRNLCIINMVIRIESIFFLALLILNYEKCKYYVNIGVYKITYGIVLCSRNLLIICLTSVFR